MAGKVSADRWRDWCTLVLAVWLFLSPWILGFAGGAGVEAVQTGALTPAAWNAWVLGLAIGAIAIWAIVRFAQWHDWANGILGIWLVVAPWILGFSAMASATWNHVVVGLLVLVLAAWELWEVRQRATA